MKTKIIESSMNESKKYIICIHRKDMTYGEYEQFINKRYKSFQDAMAEMLELKMMFPDTFKIFEVTTTYEILGD